MTDLSPLGTAKKIARDWKDEAQRRRRLSAHDQAADVLDYCAAELVEQMRPFEDPTTLLSVATFAEMRGVNSQTVRNWIHRGELDARPSGRGWLIPRGAERRRTVKSA